MEILISSAEEAFLHVGSIIGFFIILFAYINYKTNEKFINILSENKRLQPIIGALIGAIPGCGGSLIIIPLYIKNKLSFGTIVASLISSLGDASFILISSNFKLYVFITIISLITGIITGYIVDLLNLEKLLKLKSTKHKNLGLNAHTVHLYKNNDKSKSIAHSHNNINQLAYLITHKIGYIIYILILFIGFLFMVLAHSGIHSHFVEIIHSYERSIAILGILFSIIYMVSFKKVFKNSNMKEEINKNISLKETIIHSVGEISFVITWIYIAYIIYDILIIVIGGENILAQGILYSGFISVVIGAVLGIIPGCGIQIMLISFYLKGNIPLGAMIANSISQDGDALFPLIAMDKKSALWATILTTIPAILVGSLVYIVFL